MPSLSPRWNSTNVSHPVFVCIYCLRLQIAGFSFQSFIRLRGHLCVYLRLRPGNLLITHKVTLLIDFRDLVTLLPAIQATGFLALTLTGLTPAEHIRLSWTHKLVRNFTPWGSHSERFLQFCRFTSTSKGFLSSNSNVLLLILSSKVKN